MGITELLLRKTVARAKAKLVRSAKFKQNFGLTTTNSLKIEHQNSALKRIRLVDIDSVFLALTVGLVLSNSCLIIEIILFYLH